MRPWDHCPSSSALAGIAPTCGGRRSTAQTCALHGYVKASCYNAGGDSKAAAVPTLLGIQVLTFPWATSSLWAADAAFTRALVAAAMDLAASSICSSKFKDSSASCNEETKAAETDAK